MLFPYFNPVMLSNKGKTYEYGPQVRFKGYPPINLLIRATFNRTRVHHWKERHIFGNQKHHPDFLCWWLHPQICWVTLCYPFFNEKIWTFVYDPWVFFGEWFTYPRYIKIPWIPRDLCSFRALRLKIWMKSPTSADRSEAMPCFVVHGL